MFGMDTARSCRSHCSVGRRNSMRVDEGRKGCMQSSRDNNDSVHYIPPWWGGGRRGEKSLRIPPASELRLRREGERERESAKIPDWDEQMVLSFNTYE